MLNGPRCSSPERVKCAAINSRQRYTWKGCQYLYTVGQKSDASTAGHRRLAVTLYLEGLGVRSMSDLRV